MLDGFEVVEAGARPAAVIHLVIPRAEMPLVMGPSLGAIHTALAEQKVAPSGPVFAHHLRMDRGTFDFELGIPVAAPVAASGRVEPGWMPGGTVARAVYRGPYEGLGTAWEEFDAWIVAHGHTPGLDLWECYVLGPEASPDPSTWRTELNRPLLAQA